MSRRWIAVLLASACVWAASAVHGQRTTEIYIPIGLSPGLSGVHTSIGTVSRIDDATQDVILKEGSSTRVVHCTKETSFWLDRTKQRLSNRKGSLADCRAGSRIEVKYVDNDKREAVAEWIKIEKPSSE